MSNGSEFSTRSMKQVLKSVTEKRVSEKAADKLGVKLGEIFEDVADDAKNYAENIGRMTVKLEDVRKALRDREEREVESNLEL